MMSGLKIERSRKGESEKDGESETGRHADEVIGHPFIWRCTKRPMGLLGPVLLQSLQLRVIKHEVISVLLLFAQLQHAKK